MNVQTKNFRNLMASNNIDKLEKNKNYYFLCEAEQGTKVIEAKNFLPQAMIIDSGFITQSNIKSADSRNPKKQITANWYYEIYSNNTIHLYTSNYTITNLYKESGYTLIKENYKYNPNFDGHTLNIWKVKKTQSDAEEREFYTVGTAFGFSGNGAAGNYYGTIPPREYWPSSAVYPMYYSEEQGPVGISGSWIALAPNWNLPLPWGLGKIPPKEQIKTILYGNVQSERMDYWNWMTSKINQDTKTFNIQEYTCTINEVLGNKGTLYYGVHIIAEINE